MTTMENSEVLLQRFEVKNSRGDGIACDLRYAKFVERPITLVIVHSFMAFKDWGFFPYVADEFARYGYAVVTFNFSYNGVPDNGNRIVDFDRFARNTFSRELDDLHSLIERLFDGSAPAALRNHGPVALLGHSRGGGISIITASRDGRIGALVTWSSIASFDRWTNHQKNDWHRRGFLPLARSSDISPLKLGLELLQDYENNFSSLNILDAAERMTIPWLILHGSADLIVPVREAESLSKAAPHRTTRYMPLDGVDHIYRNIESGEYNFETLDSLLKITDTWLKQSLNSESS